MNFGLGTHGLGPFPQRSHRPSENPGRKVRIQPLPSRFKIIGAADISYSRHTDPLIAVIVSFRWPGLDPLESVHHVCRAASLMCRACSRSGKSRPLSRHTGKSGKNPMSCSVTGRESRTPEIWTCRSSRAVPRDTHRRVRQEQALREHESLTLRKGFKQTALPRRRAGRGCLLLQGRRKADLYLSGPPRRHRLFKKARFALPATIPDTRTSEACPHRGKQTEGGSRKSDIRRACP